MSGEEKTVEAPAEAVKKYARNTRGKVKGEASLGQMVNANHNTKHKFIQDFGDILHEKYTEGEHKGQYKLYPRPSCKDCHGTGTAGFRRYYVDGVERAVGLACACVFKKKSEKEIRMIEKAGRVIRTAGPDVSEKVG